MKSLLLLLLLAATSIPAGPPSLAATLRAAKWKQRVLLVAAPSASEVNFQQQSKLLAAASADLHERDVQVLQVLYDQLAPADQQYLRQQVKLRLRGFEVVLIGKDGGVKLRSTHPLTLATLFATIDQMPMRQQEMQRRR